MTTPARTTALNRNRDISLLSHIMCESNQVTGDLLLRWLDILPVERLRQLSWRTHPYVVGPLDLVSTLRVRREVSLRGVRSVELAATDLFVLGFGEPGCQTMTKIGGLPYRSRKKAWPVDSSGHQLQFLCQFNFLASRDLVGDTPGEILLLFTKDPVSVSPGSEEHEFYHEWCNLGLDDAITMAEVPPRHAPVVTCFGRSLRILEHAPFPEEVLERMLVDWQMQNRNIKTKWWSKYTAQPLGMKIGGLPISPITVAHGQDVQDVGRYICSLTSVYAGANVPYQWINREGELSSDEVLAPGSNLYLGNFVELNVYLTPKGEAKCVLEHIGY